MSATLVALPDAVSCGLGIRSLLASYNSYAETHAPKVRDMPGWQELTPTSDQVGSFLHLTVVNSLPDSCEPYILTRRPSHLLVAQGAVRLSDIAHPDMTLRDLSALRTGDAREQLRAVAFIPTGSETVMKAIVHPTVVVIISWFTPDAVREP